MGEFRVDGYQVTGQVGNAVNCVLNASGITAKNVQDGLIEVKRDSVYQLKTETEWNNMTVAQKESGRFAVQRESSAKFTASTISQNNTSLSSDNVQGALNTLTDSLTKRYTQLVSTSSNIVINVNTTQYKEFFIEYIVGNSANVPFFIPYGCKRNTRYRVHYKNDYANITFTDSTIEIGIANTEYTGTTVNILAR